MSNFNINSDCCELYDFSVYGCQPTGLNPGNLVVDYTSDLWEQMFGNGGPTATCSWWEAAESGWVNPFNTAEQNPRNCINFRKRCTPPDRISLTLPGDCCGRVCPSVLDQMDFLKRDPKVQIRTVQVLGPTQMCKGSVSPPVPLQDLWGNGGKVLHVTLSDPVAAPEDNFLYQVSKNGHSWTTLSVDYVTNPQSLLPILFDQSYTDCSSSCRLETLVRPTIATSESLPFKRSVLNPSPRRTPTAAAFALRSPHARPLSNTTIGCVDRFQLGAALVCRHRKFTAGTPPPPTDQYYKTPTPPATGSFCPSPSRSKSYIQGVPQLQSTPETSEQSQVHHSTAALLTTVLEESRSIPTATHVVSASLTLTARVAKGATAAVTRSPTPMGAAFLLFVVGSRPSSTRPMTECSTSWWRALWLVAE